MTNLERRVALIEGKLARLESEKISSGEIKPKHLGNKTKEVLAQEWKSLLNELSPNTMTDDESKEWYEKNLEIVREVIDHKDTKWILYQVREFRDILEKIDEVSRIL